MNPNPKNATKIEYPIADFMQLEGVITPDELREPRRFDANGEKGLTVIKRGAGTGLTFGRASSLASFVRRSTHPGFSPPSKEIAIYPYSYADGAFSGPGDSGAVVGDAESRIVGMITAGAGRDEHHDVTYVSAYCLLEQRIREAFPEFGLYPIPGSSTVTSGPASELKLIA